MEGQCEHAFQPTDELRKQKTAQRTAYITVFIDKVDVAILQECILNELPFAGVVFHQHVKQLITADILHKMELEDNALVIDLLFQQQRRVDVVE